MDVVGSERCPDCEIRQPGKHAPQPADVIPSATHLGVVQAPQLRQYGPPARGEPLLHRIRQGATACGLCEGAGKDRTVTAHRACDVERRRPRLALMAMRSGDHRTRIGRTVGMRMQPDHGQVAALMGRFGSGARLVPTGRADPRRLRRRHRHHGHRTHRISRHPRRRCALVQVSVDSSASGLESSASAGIRRGKAKSETRRYTGTIAL